MDDVLYVHLRSDGGIFVVRGADGSQAWLTEAELLGELRGLRERGGRLLYTRDEPELDPPEPVVATFRRIAELELPITLATEPHPGSQLEGGATTLMAAAYAGVRDGVADLLARGADVNARDVEGQTALMYAANAGNAEAAEALLTGGADREARDAQGSTALMFAAQHGHDGVVRVLLDAGADVEPRGSHGLTARGFARQNGHRSVERLLDEACAPE